jgi:hypothetical protein
LWASTIAALPSLAFDEASARHLLAKVYKYDLENSRVTKSRAVQTTDPEITNRAFDLHVLKICQVTDVSGFADS